MPESYQSNIQLNKNLTGHIDFNSQFMFSSVQPPLGDITLQSVHQIIHLCSNIATVFYNLIISCAIVIQTWNASFSIIFIIFFFRQLACFVVMYT